MNQLQRRLHKAWTKRKPLSVSGTRITVRKHEGRVTHMGYSIGGHMIAAAELDVFGNITRMRIDTVPYRDITARVIANRLTAIGVDYNKEYPYAYKGLVDCRHYG